MRKLACAFTEEACFRPSKVKRGFELQALTLGSKLPSGKAVASYRSPHPETAPTFVGQISDAIALPVPLDNINRVG